MERPIRVDEIDGLWTYLTSIDWSDPWFRYLILFHVICIITNILIRNRSLLQTFFFGTLLTMVYFAESINEWAAANYKLFSRQQYFDSNGLFISTVFSTPILINCLIMVVIWLLNMSSLMVEVRKAKHSKTRKSSDSKKTNEKSNSQADPDSHGDKRKMKEKGE